MLVVGTTELIGKLKMHLHEGVAVWQQVVKRGGHVQLEREIRHDRRKDCDQDEYRDAVFDQAFPKPVECLVRLVRFLKARCGRLLVRHGTLSLSSLKL